RCDAARASRRGSAPHRAADGRSRSPGQAPRSWSNHATVRDLSSSGAAVAEEAPFSGRTAWVRSLETPLRNFLRTETAGAAVLLAAAVAALAWTNVDSGSYERVWHTTLAIRVGGWSVAHDLRYWLNSGLMTLFFLVIGLE